MPGCQTPPLTRIAFDTMLGLALALVGLYVAAVGVYLAVVLLGAVAFGLVLVLGAPLELLGPARDREAARRRRAPVTSSARGRAVVARLLAQRQCRAPRGPLH